MAPRKTQGFVKKKLRRMTTENKIISKKRRVYKYFINYGPYLCKVLKNVHPQLNLSVNSIYILNSFGNDIFDRIAREASVLAKKVDKKTINSTDIKAAVCLALPPGLAQLAVASGTKAVVKYYQSKKDSNTRKLLKMNEGMKNKRKWLKCFSTKKKKTYFFDPLSKHSLWEEEFEEYIGYDNAIIEEFSDDKNDDDVKNDAVREDNATADISAKINGGTKIQSHNTLRSNETQPEEEDDDSIFLDSMTHYESTCEAILSPLSSSQGTSTNSETSGVNKRKHSDTMLEVQSRKTTAVCPKIPAKLPTSHNGRVAVDKPSLSICRPAVEKEIRACEPRINSGTPLCNTSVPFSNDSSKLQNLGKFDIPRRKVCNGNANRESDQETRAGSQLPSPVSAASQGYASLESVKTTSSSAAAMPNTTVPCNNEDSKLKKMGKFVIPKLKICKGDSDRESGGAPLRNTSVPFSNQSNKLQKLGNLAIPRLKECRPKGNSDRESEQGTRAGSQLPSPVSAASEGYATPESVKTTSSKLETSNIPGQLKKPSPMPVRRVKNSNSVEGSKSQRDPVKEQETIPNQLKNASTVSSHPQKPGHTVKKRNSLENGGLKLDSDKEREPVPSQLKNPSPVLSLPRLPVRTVRNRNCAAEPVRVSETSTSQFKEPHQILPKTPSNVLKSPEKNMRMEIDSDSDPSSSGSGKLATNYIYEMSVESAGTRQTKFPTESRGSTLRLSSAPSPAPFSTPSPAPFSAPSPVPFSAPSPAPFSDARQVLKRKSLMQTETAVKPSCTAEVSQAMDVEESNAPVTHIRSVKDRLGQRSVAQVTSQIMNQLSYKPLVLVCDTNVLIHYTDTVDKLTAGFLFDIPVSLVIPYQVFKELDNLKSQSEGARQAMRMLCEITRDMTQAILTVQNRELHKKAAKTNFEFEKDDDYVLNCALQQKEAHGNEKTVILLTADKHLQIAARLDHLISEDPEKLKVWARDYKEQTRLKAFGKTGSHKPGGNSITRDFTGGNRLETAMDVDGDPATPVVHDHASRSSIASGSQNESLLRHSGTKVFMGFVSDELKQFLIRVIKKCNERVYEELKHHASTPSTGAMLLQVLNEIRRRWNIITDKTLSIDMQNNIKQIIEITKKVNRGKEYLTKNDCDMYFICSQRLVKEFEKLYPEITVTYLETLKIYHEEWRGKAASTTNSPSEEDELQVADVALQNIYNCMRSDFVLLKEDIEKVDKNSIEQRLQGFLKKVKDILRVTITPLRDYSVSDLTANHECIIDFLLHTLQFTSEGGDTLTFELTNESALALFQQDNLRKGVEQIVAKLRRLQNDITELIEELDSDMDVMDL